MDHLPSVQSPVRQPLKVPYICNSDYTYDGAGFAGYPERCGFDIESIADSDFKGKDFTTVAPFLQAWLFFGMLSDVFLVSGIRIKEQEFLANDTESKFYISTLTLNDRIWDWVASESDLTSPGRLDRLKQVDEILSLAERITEAIVDGDRYSHLGKRAYYEDKNAESSDGYHPGELVILSVTILGEALSKAKHLVFELSAYGAGRPFRWEVSGLLYRLLEDSGWCAGRIAVLDSTFDSESKVSYLYYLSFQDRHREDKDHSQCSERLCIADQVDRHDYASKHLNDCGGCENAQIEEDSTLSVALILRAGGIPLISLGQRCDDGRTKVLLQRSKHQRAAYPVARHLISDLKARRNSRRPLPLHMPRIPYVAFSHVWGDGLGNPESNSLPQCQLRHLQDLANQSVKSCHNGNTPFWIDTMCVPLETEGRQLAIRRMARTYDDAIRVVVLDSTLMNASPNLTLLEKLSLIENSGWSHRLWTLQEGVRARNLDFLFSRHQGIVSFDDLVRQYEREFKSERPQLDRLKHRHTVDDDSYALKLIRAMAIWNDDADDYIRSLPPEQHSITETDTTLGGVFQLRRICDISDSMLADCYQRFLANKLIDNPDSDWNLDFSKHRLIAKICNVIRFRLTSRPKDEAVCLANLLGLDISSIARQATHENNMRAFYQLIKNHIPIDLLFLATRKFQDDGYRWAPISFLDIDRSVDGGLYMPIFDWRAKAKLRLDGLEIRSAGLALDVSQTKFLPDDRQMTFTVDGRPQLYAATLRHSNPPPTWTKYRQCSLALVSDTDKHKVQTYSHEHVAVADRKGNIVFKKRLAQTYDLPSRVAAGSSVLVSVQVSKKGVLYTRYEHAISCEGTTQSSCSPGTAITTRMLPPSQKWCIK